MKHSLLLWFLLLLGALFGLPGALSHAEPEASPSEAAEAPITLFFVRHAETAGSTRTGGDPELSEGGRERARTLARLLGRARVSRFFSSEYARTRGTLAPLLEASGVEGARIEVVPASSKEEQLELLRALEPGTVAVIAGHSNTVPGMIVGLGGKLSDVVQHERYGPMLAHHQYDRLFCVSLDPESAQASSTLELAYGEACPAPAGEPR